MIVSNLVTFDDVTKKAAATVDPKKVVDVADISQTGTAFPASDARVIKYGEHDGLYGFERLRPIFRTVSRKSFSLPWIRRKPRGSQF